jgi:hypothetical protein
MSISVTFVDISFHTQLAGLAWLFRLADLVVQTRIWSPTRYETKIQASPLLLMILTALLRWCGVFEYVPESDLGSASVRPGQASKDPATAKALQGKR